jgi:ABC-2 type transport system ATP-binding protein
MSDSVIEVCDLVVRFGSVTALAGVSFDVRAGEMFCIVGPDGAGKTSLLRVLCGILRPASGSARVLGFDTSSGLSKIKPLIGYFSQKWSLYGDLTVDENIEFFAEIHGVRSFAKEREKLLAFTRLAPYRKRLADKLSGGMKQKLALACTLVHAPKVLFLDEPTTGVDPVSRRDFWLILAGLIKDGLTILMTTPYMDEAERASRVGLLDRGRLLMADTPSKVRDTMSDAVLEIVCSPARGAFGELARRARLRDIELFGDRLNVVLYDEGDAESVIGILRASGIEVVSFRFIQPRLENVFISLMKREKEDTGA